MCSPFLQRTFGFAPNLTTVVKKSRIRAKAKQGRISKAAMLAEIAWLCAFVPAIFVLVTVFRQSKNVAALVQMGSVIGRSSSEIDGVRTPSQAFTAKAVSKMTCFSPI